MCIVDTFQTYLAVHAVLVHEALLGKSLQDAQTVEVQRAQHATTLADCAAFLLEAMGGENMQLIREVLDVLEQGCWA